MSRRRAATHPSTTISVTSALLAITAGRPVVLVDDLPRRSGDEAALVAAAAAVTVADRGTDVARGDPLTPSAP